MDIRPLKYPAAILLGVFLSLNNSGQKAQLIEDKEIILKRAAEAFDASLETGAALYNAVVEEKLIGRYVLQVSFKDKGDITSVFVVSAEAHDIRSQNRIKDLVHLSRLPFKTPKGRQYRLEHTFDLNAIQR